MISTIRLFLRPVGLFALGAGAIIFANASAHAAEEYYVFKSLLSTPNAGWCIDVPQYQAASHAVVSACSGKSNQTFGYESGGTLTNGGYCLDALPANPGQPPSAGDPIVIAECNGSDPQIWQLQPFKSRSDAFAIVNPDGFCVSVDGPIGEGTQLVLAQCAEQDNQGWLRTTTASGGEEIYWYSGHRYCWYDGGWHGPGWYWCGENFHQGIGWGGPIGWHWWHHHGHPPHFHPLPHPHHPGPPPHPVPHPHLHVVPHPHTLIHPHVVPHPHPHPMIHRHPTFHPRPTPHPRAHH